MRTTTDARAHPVAAVMAPKKTIEKKPAGAKKPLKGYMKFAQERRPSLKTEQPDLTFGEVRHAQVSLRSCLLDDDRYRGPPGWQGAWCRVARHVGRRQEEVRLSVHQP